jgi:hypothetical protein
MRLLRPIPIGYSLHHTVKLAIDEGIIPVVLTGRFLRRMSNLGFFWLPGVKYQDSSGKGDIDLLACCDGYLIFCECKNLCKTKGQEKNWDEIVAQFLRTAEIAKRCKGNLVVLSSQVDNYPAEVRDRIVAELKSSIPFLLLDNKDLEKGHREIQVNNLRGFLGLGDLIPRRFQDLPGNQSERGRIINYGWGVYGAVDRS